MNRKRMYSLILVFAVIVLFTGSAAAADTWVKKDLYYGGIKITLNGNTITPKDANGTIVEPFTIDGTTYLPVRSISNALGINVDWDEATKTVVLQTPSLSPAELYAQCRQSVVQLDTGFSGGTGFFIEEDIIVTNNHVINGAYKITAKTVDGDYMNVTHIIAKSENPDLAILKVDGKGTPVRIASSIAGVGTDAYTIGAPLGIFPTFSSGMVMNNTYEENGTSFYLTSIGAISGNSGGPVFNDRGEVIGVVQGGMGDGSNTMDMMIKIDHIRDLDRSNPQELSGKEPLPEDDITKASSLASAQVGELVSFGTYEQDNDPATTGEEILWIVTNRNGDELTLMSLYALDVIPMMLEDGIYSWEKSYAREFLNGEFFNKAFSAAERAKILAVNVENKPNPIHGTPNGNPTVDHVYLPDFDEILAFYHIDRYEETVFSEVSAYATPYTASKGVWLEMAGSNKCWWWLRSSGGSNSNAAEVGTWGYISYNGTDANDDPLGGGRAIRPVIHISAN